MYLQALFMILSAAVSITECRCRTGFERLGEVLYAAENQLDKVFEFANLVCPACVNETEFGCFNNLLNDFKMDLADLRSFEYSVIDSYLTTDCTFGSDLLFVGGDSDMPSQVVEGLSTDELPITFNFGIDCDVRNDMLVHAKADSNQLIQIKGSDFTTLVQGTGDIHLQRPRFFDPDTVYYVGSNGGIFRVADGVVEEIVSAATTGVISDLEVDPLESVIYWTTADPEEKSVFQATRNGQEITTLFSSPDNPINLSLDSFSRRLYFTTATALRYYDLRDGLQSDIADLPKSTSEISVCTNSIYLSYIIPGTWEIRDLQGVVTGPAGDSPNIGNVNIVALATCNFVP